MQKIKCVPPDGVTAYTRSQAAYCLQLSLRTIDTLIKRKEIKATKVGQKNGAVRIPKEEIERFGLERRLYEKPVE